MDSLPDPEKCRLLNECIPRLHQEAYCTYKYIMQLVQKVIENYEHLGMNTYGKDGFSDKYYFSDHLFTLQLT